jgi:hypothetical protein
MSVVGVIVVVTTLVGVLLFVHIKQGAFFEPRFSADFPEKLKPFLKTNKHKKIRATANPRHILLPLLKEITEEEEDLEVTKVNVDIMSYKFAYDGYSPTDEWYETLVGILEKKGRINLIGGMPSEENLEGLKKLFSLGANVRILTEPPTTHFFIYSRESNPVFIWFEGDHQDGRAKCIAYTDSPSKDDAKIARGYFDNLWKRGKTIKELSHAS